MRIRFGLILKITERTKSYKPPKQHYFIKTPETQAKLPIFSGSHPNYSLNSTIIPHNLPTYTYNFNPNPKPHKTPKSIHPQKQHNTVIKFLLFLGSLP